MPSVYFIPSGPANLREIFSGVNFSDIDEYYITTSVCQTPILKMEGCDDDVIISFVNYLGAIDSIGFAVTIEHEAKSATFQKSLKYPLEKAHPALTRLSIKSNDNYDGTCLIPENQMPWLDELLDSPMAWMQVNGDYIPIIITDQKIVKKKEYERFNYEVSIQWSLSHERIIISN